MLMAGFVLFGTTVAAPQNGNGLLASPVQVSVPALPGAGLLLPLGR
jgi:hypothetical protein